MNNAQQFFDELVNYKTLVELIGTQEDIFIDFKQTASTDGLLTVDDKKNFAKAASGFAHQEGGLIVWGILADKGDDGIDQARKLTPIGNLKKFKQSLESYVKQATEPAIDGIQNKIIFNKDDSESDKGFVLTYIPKSEREHQASFKGDGGGFYKRHGDGFFRLTTSEVKALFFRTFSPDLELTVADGGRFIVKNSGKTIAKYVALYVGFVAPPGHVQGWYDGEGNTAYKLGVMHISPDTNFRKLFIFTEVIHPGQILIPLTLALAAHTKQTYSVRYKIFAENMMPKEGVIEVDT